jgi:predicted transcriptional regulator
VQCRERIEIVSANLEAANGGVTKTKIISQVFPTYAQVKEHVKMLVESNLLSFDL